MRLTNEFRTMELVDYIDKYDIKGFSGCPSDEQKIYAKLGQLEDIEDELGIDLITFHKALNNGIYVKRMGGFITDYDGYLLSFQGDCFVVGHGYDTYVYYFKDYGKTWALTREELL